MNFLWDRIQTYCERTPRRLAVIEPDCCSLSFAELRVALGTLSGMLVEAGLGCGDRVAVILPDGASGLVSLLGAAKVCACAPLNPALTATELEADLATLQASAVITAGNLEIPLAVAAKLGLVVIRAEVMDGSCAWRVARSGQKRRADTARGDDDPALLLFTSATTGRRKLVPLSSRNLQAQVENSARSLRLAADDRLLMLARLFHTQGILSPLAQLLAGGSILMIKGFAPQALRGWVERFEPTWYTCGPTLHRAILSHLEGNPLPSKSSLRFVRSGGAPLDARLRTRLECALGVPVLNVYGLSETGAVACTTREICVSEDYLAQGVAVGPSMGPAIATMSADGCLLPAGEEGEIVVSGPTVMTGYLDDPEANRKSFAGRWFRTGDLGQVDERGWLHITGRLKEIINRGGQKVIPDEVDAVLAAHPAVLEAAAFGVPHPTLGEDVACAVVLREGVDAEEADLRAFAARQLAAFKVPRKIYKLAAIPHGATGKAQRLVLQERFGSAASAAGIDFAVLRADRAVANSPQIAPGHAPAGSRPIDLEESLAGLWHKYSQGDADHVGTDFFSAGGDSLSAVMLLSEAEELFSLDVVLSSGTFFKEPTLSTLTRMVAEAVDGRSEVFSSALEVVPIRKGTAALSLFMIPSDGEEGCGFRRLARALEQEWPMALLRPGNCWYDRDGSPLEEQASQAVNAMIKARPEGPYMLAGYCYGGVVAYEAARQLEARGAQVLLLLFDVPLPGYPQVVTNAGIYARAAADAFRSAWETRRAWPLVHFAGRTIRRATWSGLRMLNSKIAGKGQARLLRWMRIQSSKKYFSLYRPGPLQAPVLHFLAEHEPDRLPAESRFGWRRTGLCQTTERWIHCSHNHLLDPAHIASIAAALSGFAAQQLTSDGHAAAGPAAYQKAHATP